MVIIDVQQKLKQAGKIWVQNPMGLTTAPSPLPSQPSVGECITDSRKDNDDDGSDDRRV